VTGPVQITLLTKDDCGFCDHAKQVLLRLGDTYPLRVTEIDLATHEGRQLASTGGVLFAPGVLVEGRAFPYGRLSERKLRRTLDKRLSQRSG
jgi:glutaredoxin